MPLTPFRPRAALTLVTAVAAVTAAAALPSPAAAAGFTCDASALRGTILGQAAIEPVTANRGSAECTNDSAGGAVLADALAALPVSASALSAKTIVTPSGTPNDKQGALASGGLAGLTVKALPTLPITLPTASIPPELLKLEVPLSSLTPLNPLLGLLGLPSTLTFDLKPAIDALLPNGGLPNVDLLSFGAATAYAGASCQDGTAKAFGASQVADLKVLGDALPTDQLLSQVLSVIDSGSIDLSKLDLTKIELPLGLTSALGGLLPTLLGPIQETVLKPLVAALPKIEIPATLASVKLTPSSQTIRPDGTLVQQGPRLQVSIAGQSLADVILGEATIGGTAGVDCVVPAATPPPSAADLALQCTTRRLVLVDVLNQNGRVKFLGAADRKLAGRSVGLRLKSNSRTVATATVRADGSFSATAPLPPKSIRNTDKARYQAFIGSEKSLDLKLTRRMLVNSVTSSDGKVTLKGRVVLPLAKSVAQITLTRRLSCKTVETVKRFKPKSDGTFTVTVDAPDDATAAVYRMSTFVRKTTRSNSTSKTFTLPRGVNLDK
ncbi:hypothetical protein DSM112329_00525 [Paraconexibacter sp. AEG42_29]|uniref:Choice-of-anchor G family protein n=1 Tax=Paraconexibacter sp. AEG42_29 TaxID=2997339 RepID=A0AAU7APY8_9ACTN